MRACRINRRASTGSSCGFCAGPHRLSRRPVIYFGLVLTHSRFDLLKLTTLKGENHESGYYSTDRIDPGAGRGAANMAAQFELGIWSKRDRRFARHRRDHHVRDGQTVVRSSDATCAFAGKLLKNVARKVGCKASFWQVGCAEAGEYKVVGEDSGHRVIWQQRLRTGSAVVFQ